MPFQSQAQKGYFFANRDKLEGQGVNVNEWAKSSKGLKLPKRAPTRKLGTPKLGVPKVKLPKSFYGVR